MAYKLKVNKDKCIGCGNCVAVCPKSFELKVDKSIVKKEVIENIGCEKEAEELCPTKAISITKTENAKE